MQSFKISMKLLGLPNASFTTLAKDKSSLLDPCVRIDTVTCSYPTCSAAPKTFLILSPLCLPDGKESIYQEEFCFMVLLQVYFNQWLIHLGLALSSFPEASPRQSLSFKCC